MKINNNDHGKFTGPSEVRLMRLLPGPIERVWEYLTDPEKRSRWFAGGPMELKTGGKLALHMRHADLSPQETPPDEYKKMHYEGKKFDGQVLACEPPRLLRYTWGEGGNFDVTFELTSQGDQVLLVLTHRNYGDAADNISSFASGWHTHVAMLLAVLAGEPPPPFWASHLRLEAEYEKLLATGSA
jgi:uncharacterized protein YndB with AHSA1/START domain